MSQSSLRAASLYIVISIITICPPVSMNASQGLLHLKEMKEATSVSCGYAHLHKHFIEEVLASSLCHVHVVAWPLNGRHKGRSLQATGRDGLQSSQSMDQKTLRLFLVYLPFFVAAPGRICSLDYSPGSRGFRCSWQRLHQV